MAKLTILTFPDNRLRTHAKPVTQVNSTIRRHVDDLLDTMYAAPGLGLAATQVGIPWRIVVMDVSENHNDSFVLINPEILSADGEQEREEGCLSVPGFYETVQRPATIQVRALNPAGQVLEFSADGLLAVCIQHELDHLNGKLFVDYLSAIKRQRIRQKLEKDRRSPATAESNKPAARRRSVG
ncbi:peptide deformylase [Thiospirillum jenense]|uniref:Peptide deformylase n=1 Tax=Thiospirillum jenense TaxID=1653858 RepID=A0A839H8X9_9GAMM|nr:peptide deformylase [Thiospirillum jenense]MBB1125414.1 peptide deformylase [Thiospirillum jenense]